MILLPFGIIRVFTDMTLSPEEIMPVLKKMALCPLEIMSIFKALFPLEIGVFLEIGNHSDIK
jgi:hypothetical protein